MRLVAHAELRRDGDADFQRWKGLRASGGRRSADRPGQVQQTGPKGPPKRYKGGKPPVPREGTRLERQRRMSLPEMLEELPRNCDIGSRKSSKGHQQYWRGYKLHLDVADGQVPISAVPTSASVHDSQVAIPLATMSTQRVQYCYDLMDAAYDATHIAEQCRSLGHVPIIDPVLRGKKHRTPFFRPSSGNLAGRKKSGIRNAP